MGDGIHAATDGILFAAYRPQTRGPRGGTLLRAPTATAILSRVPHASEPSGSITPDPRAKSLTLRPVSSGQEQDLHPTNRRFLW